MDRQNRDCLPAAAHSGENGHIVVVEYKEHDSKGGMDLVIAATLLIGGAIADGTD